MSLGFKIRQTKGFVFLPYFSYALVGSAPRTLYVPNH